MPRFYENMYVLYFLNEECLLWQNIDLSAVITSQQLHWHPIIIEDVTVTSTDACTIQRLRKMLYCVVVGSVQAVAENIAQQPRQKHIIIVDDIDMLEIYLGDIQAGRKAISSIHAIVNRHSKVCLSSSLLVSHAVQNCAAACFGRDVTAKLPAAFSETPIHVTQRLQRSNLTEYVKHRCDITVVVSCLGTGYSMDIHGQVTIVHKCEQKAFTFKALDSGIQCSLLR